MLQRVRCLRRWKQGIAARAWHSSRPEPMVRLGREDIIASSCTLIIGLKRQGREMRQSEPCLEGAVHDSSQRICASASWPLDRRSDGRSAHLCHCKSIGAETARRPRLGDVDEESVCANWRPWLRRLRVLRSGNEICSRIAAMVACRIA